MVGSTPKDIAVSWGLDEVKIPFGFSHFPYEIAAASESWAESTGKISFFENHDKGGHFAAFEQSDLMWQDIVEFVDHVKAAMKE